MERQGIFPDSIKTAAFLLVMALALPADAQTGGSVQEFQLPPGQAAPPPSAEGPVDPERPVPVQPVEPVSAPPPAATPPPLVVPPPPIASPGLPAGRAGPPQGASNAPARPAPAQPAQPGQPVPPPFSDAAPPAPAPAPPVETAPLAEAPPAATPDRSLPFTWWIAGGALLALLLSGLALILRRRRREEWEEDLDLDAEAQAPVEEMLPPPLPVEKAPAPPPSPVADDGRIVAFAGRTAAPARPRQPALAADRITLRFEPQRLIMAMVNATLAYRLLLTNRGSEVAGPVRIAGDIIPADASLGGGEQLLMGAGMAEPLHQLQSLGPGETIELKGMIRFPVAAIPPIRSGNASLFVPLARFHIAVGGPGQPPLVSTRVFVVGESPAQPGERLKPIRIDLGPRTLSSIGQRELELPGAA